MSTQHAPGGASKAFWTRERQIVAVALACAGGYAAYKACTSPSSSSAHAATDRDDAATSTSSSTQQPTAGFFSRLRATVSNYAQAVSAGSGACAAIASDLQAFLTSDSNEVPRSLRQLAKLLQSTEVQSCLQTSVETAARGAANAAAAVSGMHAGGGAGGGPSTLETVLEAALSDRGRSLLGLAVGVASKNATATFCEFLERMQAQQAQQPSAIETVVSVLASESGDRLLSLLITRSIRTAMTAYVDATAGYNMYEDMVASITKQEHRDAVTDIMTRITAAFCKEVAAAYRKASATPANQQLQRGSSSGAGAAAGAPVAVAEANGYVNGSAAAWEEAASRSSMDEATASCVVVQHGAGGAGSQHGEPAAARALLPHPRKGAAAAVVSLPLARHNPLRQHGGAAAAAAPTWVRQVASLAKERDVRALVVDVAGSSMREATRGMIETLVETCGLAPRSGGTLDAASAAWRAAVPVYALLTVLVVLLMFVFSPPAIVHTLH